jgi:hypothetical protein
MHDRATPLPFALLAACLMLLVAPVRAADTATPPTCDAREAFGIPFGPMPKALLRTATPVDLHDPAGVVSPMAVYRIRAARGDLRFEHFDVATNRTTGEIFQVIAYGPAFDPGEEAQYDERVVPRLRPFAAAFAQENGLPLSTEGRPPYNAANEDIEIFVGHAFDRRGLRFTFTCIQRQAQRRYEHDALRALFRQIGDSPGTSSPRNTRP